MSQKDRPQAKPTGSAKPSVTIECLTQSRAILIQANN